MIVYRHFLKVFSSGLRHQLLLQTTLLKLTLAGFNLTIASTNQAILRRKISEEKILARPGFEPWALGETHECFLCAMLPRPPPCVQTLLFALAVKKGSDELIWLGTIEILRYTAEAPIAFAG